MTSFNRQSSSYAAAATSKSISKRPAAVVNAARAPAAAQQQSKKRVALGVLTNLGNMNPAPAMGAKNGNKVNTASSISKTKKEPVANVRAENVQDQNPVITPFDLKPTSITSTKDTLFPVNDGCTLVQSFLAPCSTVMSPCRSGDSVSLDETISTCDSMKSPNFEYIDNGDSSAIASLEWRATKNLHISEDADAAGYAWKREVPVAMETAGRIIDVDSSVNDPQLCPTLACDIYEHLRIAETKKRPSMDFMQRVQKDINASMRAILIDWLVEVAEEYMLVPDTLYLTVNYIDRYLSGNEINRQRLQLLGVTCMMIAAKYEEVCAPQVEEFCYITDNTYFKDEVLQMEAAVLKHLKFEMTAPTVKCFLRRFVRVAHGCDEALLLQLDFVASYVAELSLIEYDLLRYSPSLIAAASVFLARFILQPTKQPWNATLVRYTQYKPSELCDCTKALHKLFCNCPGSSLPAIREKYSQHKYKFVAKKYCPCSIPSEFFLDSNSLQSQSNKSCMRVLP